MNDAAKDEEKGLRPPISDLRPHLRYAPQNSYYRSPFEIARDEEVHLQRQAAEQVEQAAYQARRAAELLAWAKQKGLLSESAMQLPDGDTQGQLLKKWESSHQLQT